MLGLGRVAVACTGQWAGPQARETCCAAALGGGGGSPDTPTWTWMALCIGGVRSATEVPRALDPTPSAGVADRGLPGP